MKAVLASSGWLRQPEFGHGAENTAPMDWFVLATLGFLFFLLGCFATWAWLLWRRSEKPTPHVKLLMEMEDAEHQAEARNAPVDTKEPWERPPDWWKK